MNRPALPRLALLALCLILASATGDQSRAEAAEPNPGSPLDSTTVLDPTAIDKTMDPCQDFYQFSCGNWLARTTLPQDQSAWDRSFSTIYDGNLNTIRTVLENYSTGKFDPVTSVAKQLGDYYASCMDLSTIEKQTDAAVRERLGIVESLRTKRDLPALIAKLHLQDVTAIFGFSPSADLKVPTLMIAEIDQGGMGLPNRNTYFDTDDHSAMIRQEYKAYIAKMFVLTGMKEADAKSAAETTFALETRLAQAALPADQMQDPTKLYNPTDEAGLEQQAPDFNWKSYFVALGIKRPTSINITEPKFLAEVNDVIKTTDVAVLRTYLKWHVLSNLAPALGAKYYNTYFDFAGRVLSGKKTQSPRWKICVQSASSGMGEAVGQAFVKKTFSPEAKQRVTELIDKLRVSFEQDFQTLDWLDAPTRTAALEKLALLTRKIGYPDQWRSFGDLNVTRNSFWTNRLRAGVFNNRYELAKIGGRVNPDEWHMTPQTVNAYYDPNVNQINFPAGILQPPFFSNTASDAENFGAIGMVIGHEMTHGFDTSGSQFDGHGAQRDWWTPSVKSLFQSKAQCLMNQYDQYEVLPGVHVNGHLTITENIADQGGLKLAFNAFRLATQGRAVPPIAGLDGDQQFFVSMAQLWCEKSSEAYDREITATDPHSPARFRVIGTVVNNPDFANAFKCAAGAPMAPVNRCQIW